MTAPSSKRRGNIPRIQLSGSKNGLTRYIQAVERAGGVPVPGISPDLDPSCDALVLCGGGDLDPALFGQKNQGSQPPDRERDRAEMALLEAYLTWNRPVLGICRGMQVLNVFLGGTLIQDLPLDWQAAHRGDEDVYHTIRCRPGSLLERLLGPCPLVNSAHHQAVDRLGHDLRACAWAPEGFVEGVEHIALPVMGVQFHPERLSGPGRGEGSTLFDWLITCIET